MTGSAAFMRDQVQALVEAFCGDDPGRSAAVWSLRFAAGQSAAGLAGVRGDVPRPAASIMKVPMAIALLDRAAGGAVTLAAEVSVADLGGTRYASLLAAFAPGRSLTLMELLGLALIVSDNPATVRVMSEITLADINAVLRQAKCSAGAHAAAGFTEAELGPANRVNTLTAEDCVILFHYLAAKPRYQPILKFLENNLRNNRIPALLADDVVVAHKTGSLDGVVNDAGMVSRGGRSFTIAVLCDGQPDPMATSREIAELSARLCDLLLA